MCTYVKTATECVESSALLLRVLRLVAELFASVHEKNYWKQAFVFNCFHWSKVNQLGYELNI